MPLKQIRLAKSQEALRNAPPGSARVSPAQDLAQPRPSLPIAINWKRHGGSILIIHLLAVGTVEADPSRKIARTIKKRPTRERGRLARTGPRTTSAIFPNRDHPWTVHWHTVCPAVAIPADLVAGCSIAGKLSSIQRHKDGGETPALPAVSPKPSRQAKADTVGGRTGPPLWRINARSLPPSFPHSPT